MSGLLIYPALSGAKVIIGLCVILPKSSHFRDGIILVRDGFGWEMYVEYGVDKIIHDIDAMIDLTKNEIIIKNEVLYIHF